MLNTDIQIPFKVSNFCITDEAVPQKIADAILRHHIQVVLSWRLRTGIPIWASGKSCYRPKNWEIARKRDPGSTGRDWSRHTFVDGKGACDWTTRKESYSMMEMAKMLADSEYHRVCYYPKDLFIHCDYKGNKGKQFFIAEGNEWLPVDDKSSWLEHIRNSL